MRIFIGIPCEKGWMRAETALAYTSSLLYLRERGHEVNGSIVSLESISNARSIIVEDGRSWKADFIGMVDDDMVFNPDAFDRLLQHNVDAVVASYTHRTPPYESQVYDLVDVELKLQGIHDKKYVPKRVIHRGLNKCDGFGTGLVLFKASIFEQILRPWFFSAPPTALEDGRMTLGSGEDLFFCSRARKFGFQPYYDGDTEVGHVGGSVIATPSLARHLGTFKIEEAVSG